MKMDLNSLLYHDVETDFLFYISTLEFKEKKWNLLLYMFWPFL